MNTTTRNEGTSGYFEPVPSSPLVTSLKRVSWASIAAGVALAIAIQLFLSLIGAGLGLSTLDPLTRGSSPDASTLGVSAVAWWAVTSAISLFIAGAVASHLSGSARKSDATLHGLITWSVVTLCTVYVLASLLGSVARGAAGVAGTAATVTATGVAAVAGPATDLAKKELEAQGVSFDMIKSEARKLLQQTGKADLQPGAITAKASEVAGDAKQAGSQAAADPMSADAEFDSILQKIIKAGKDTVDQVDREALVNVVMARSNLTRPEAEKRVDNWINTYQQAQVKFAEQKVKAEQKAREVADATAKATAQGALGAAFALLVGAAAAAFGGLSGRSRRTIGVGHAPAY